MGSRRSVAWLGLEKGGRAFWRTSGVEVGVGVGVGREREERGE